MTVSLVSCSPDLRVTPWILGAGDVEAAHGVAEAQLAAAGAQVGGGLVDVEAAQRDLGDAEARGVAGAEEGALEHGGEHGGGGDERVVVEGAPDERVPEGVAQGGGLAEAAQPAVAGLVVVGAGDLAAQDQAGAQGRGLVEQAEAAHGEQAGGEVQRGGQGGAVEVHALAAGLDHVDAEVALEVDAVGGVDGAQEGEGLAVAAHEEVLAVVEFAAGRGVGEAAGAAASGAGGLEDEDLAAGLGEADGGGQAGEAGPEDQDGGGGVSGMAGWAIGCGDRGRARSGEVRARSQARYKASEAGAGDRQGGDLELVAAAQGGAAGEDVVVAGADLEEDLVVGAAHDLGGEEAAVAELGEDLPGGLVLALGGVGEVGGGGDEAAVVAVVEDVGLAEVVAGEQVAGEVDAAAGGVLGDVAEDVGVLEGEAEVLGVAAGGGLWSRNRAMHRKPTQEATR
jgi:hypothetical protein